MYDLPRDAPISLGQPGTPRLTRGENHLLPVRRPDRLPWKAARLALLNRQSADVRRRLINHQLAVGTESEKAKLSDASAGVGIAFAIPGVDQHQITALSSVVAQACCSL